MKLHLRNYRGIESADIDLSGVAIVVGPNGSGKTSVAEGLKACLTGLPIVVQPEVEKIPQKDAAQLVHDGAKRGYVELKDGDEISFSINYPSCKSKSKGRTAQASEVACGSEDHSLPRLRPQYRTSALAKLIDAVPSLADLVNYLGERNIDLGAKQAEQLWKIIEAEDWDGAHQRAKNKGQELKGKYQEASHGQAWSKDGAGDWRPDDYDPEWDGRDIAFFETGIVAAQQHYDETVGKGFVAASERRALEATAAELNDRITVLEKLTDQIKASEQALAETQARHDATLPADIFWRKACPHCGAEIAAVRPVSGGMVPELRKSEKMPDAEDKKDRRVAIADIEGEISNRRDTLRDMTRDQRAAELAVSDSQRARDRMAGFGTPATQDEERARQEAAGIVDRAHQNYAIFKSYMRTTSLDTSIQNNRILVESLSALGVRHETMGLKLEPFNARVSDICASMGIPPVLIDGNLQVFMGKRAYRICSESEKFRIRIALQIAWAIEDRSDMVVIDNEVDMDPKYYIYLIRTLCLYKLKALISIRIDRRARHPRLEDAPDDVSGVVYWLEDGKAEEVSRAE